MHFTIAGLIKHTLQLPESALASSKTYLKILDLFVSQLLFAASTLADHVCFWGSAYFETSALHFCKCFCKTLKIVKTYMNKICYQYNLIIKKSNLM